ncbi:MAG: tyrosine--tRNA ligase [Elusimicrobia bacterium RIFOXYA2_FULL_39_19]|nr:MAG: tyrosine--tRNA ligase [Elusimicrobia bacterium RIFOXYA2_FULL_39_19]
MTAEFLKKVKRGTVELISEEELAAKLSKKKQLRVKLGVDPTSPDIHLGHTVALRKLRLFQDNGHTVVFIVGDFTAQVGDPSGQNKTRPVLSEEQILQNAKTYTEQVFKILDRSKTEVVYNSTWLKELGIKGLLTLTSKYTVARMLERNDFSERYKNDVPITILEFIYPLLQGQDSVAIKSDIELGGTDQKFNLLVGRELQRDAGQEPQVVMTLPLLVGTDGVKKMSKSYKNYIALNDTPKDMFGKLMSIPDDVMKVYYELLTDFEVKKYEDDISANPRSAKARLAHEIVKQYYGQETADKEQNDFDNVFSNKQLPLSSDVPQLKALEEEYKALDLLTFCAAELKIKSKNDARRLIDQGAVEYYDISTLKSLGIMNKDTVIKITEPVMLRAGKKAFCCINPRK